MLEPTLEQAASDTNTHTALESSDVRLPLAEFEGEMPPSPGWFDAVMADAPEVESVEVDGAAIQVLTWGDRGKPGLLFLHGNGAHAGWWRFIAPFFASEYRVAAFSWSGMGGSGHREKYTMDEYVAEILAVATATGLFESPVAPRMVGHSFGGYAMMAAASVSNRFGSAVIVDTPFRRADEPREAGPPRANATNRPHVIYATLAAALARFRLAPVQSCANPFLVDRIARDSIEAVDGGWGWRFDPYLWSRSEFDPNFDVLPKPRCPVALIWGDRSALMPSERVAQMKADLPVGSPAITIADAAHHVMLDQPAALVKALENLFAAWPSGTTLELARAEAV